MKQLVVPIIALTVLVSGCAGNLAQDGWGSPGSEKVQTLRYNGMTLTELPPDVLSRNALRPHIRSYEDIRATDELTKFYADLSWKAFAAKDYDSFVVARSLAAKMAGIRLAQSLTTAAMTQSYIANNGVTTMPANSVGFMPARMYGNAIRKAALDFDFPGETKGDLVANAEPVDRLAAGEGYPGYGRQNPELERQRQQSGWGKNPKSLLSMPVGSAYLATARDGKKFIVENTKDGFLFYNTGKDPVRFSLDDLDYFPVLDEPSPIRKKAAPIVRNVADSLDSIFWPVVRKGDLGANAFAVSPSMVVVTTYPEVRRELDEYGMVATSRTEIEKGKSAYRTNPAYKLAVDMMGANRFGTKEASNFIMKCGGGKTKLIRYEGDATEFMRFSCFDRDHLVYTERMIVMDDMRFKTMASMREDRRLAERIRGVMDDAALIDAVAGFVPGLSNLDAGMRCLGTESASSTMTKLYSHFFRPEVYQMGVERFVNSLLPEPNAPSVVDKALDCSLAAGGLGRIAKGATAAKAGYADYVSKGKLDGVKDVLSLFDQNFVGRGAGDKWAESFKLIDQRFAGSPNAARIVKGFYEAAQGTQDVTQLYDAVRNHSWLNQATGKALN